MAILNSLKTSATGAGADLNKVLRNCIAGLIVFSVILLCFICYLKKANSVVTFLAVAGAAVLGGASVGFLFGIPRTEKYRYKSDADHGAKDYYYSDNTNLEEISDWLTKIIVGLTLVKFRTILNWMDSAARSISKTLSADAGCKDGCTDFYVFSYAIIILYVIAGTAMAYLWTRINFSKILTTNILDLRDIEANRQEKRAGLRVLNPQLADDKSDESFPFQVHV